MCTVVNRVSEVLFRKFSNRTFTKICLISCVVKIGRKNLKYGMSSSQFYIFLFFLQLTIWRLKNTFKNEFAVICYVCSVYKNMTQFKNELKSKNMSKCPEWIFLLWLVSNYKKKTNNSIIHPIYSMAALSS